MKSAQQLVNSRLCQQIVLLTVKRVIKLKDVIWHGEKNMTNYYKYKDSHHLQLKKAPVWYTISSWYLTQSSHNILDHLWGNYCCWKMKQHILRFPQSLILIFLWIHVQNDCRCRKQFASSFLCQLWHENTFCHKTFNSTIFLLKVLWCRYILCCQQTILIDDMRLSSALKRFPTGQQSLPSAPTLNS